MWFKVTLKKKTTIGVGRFVEIVEHKYINRDDYRENPRLRIECIGDGLKVTLSERFDKASINLSRKDALELAEAIVDHFGAK